MSLLPRSIGWRMALWHGALLALVLVAFAFTAWKLRWQDEMRRVDAELQQQQHTLLGMLHDGAGGPPQGAPPPRPRRPGAGNPFLPPPLFDDDNEDRMPPPERVQGPRELQAWIEIKDEVGRYYRVWMGPEHRVQQEAGALAAATGAWDPDDLQPLVPQTGERYVQGRLVREARVIAPREVLIVVGRTLEPEQAIMRALAWKLALLGGAVWLLAFAGGLWLTKHTLRPIHSITETATRLSSGTLRERINVDETESELGQLAAVLNNTFARLQQSFDQQAQFTADAAHELRTPVTVMLSQTQLALSRERSPKEYRDTLEACQRAAKRMQSLTESLLQLSKLDAGSIATPQAPVDLASVAQECAEMIRPLADARGVTLEIKAEPLTVKGDAGQLAQVLTNLLSNALQHSPENTRIRVIAAREGGDAIASVQDSGPGIAAEHLPHLFDRFYRAEGSRNRHSGGAGLGLAICQAIAHAHQGRMTVASAPGEGSTFTLHVPLAMENG